MNSLYINGVIIDTPTDCSPWFNRPEKNIESVQIPGRNGSLVIDHGTFNNFVATFPCFIKDYFENQFPVIVSRQLGGLKGYQRITCTVDPTHYREGVVLIPTSPRPVRLNKDGFFDLNIEFKPQRFLLAGETAQTLTASGTVANPTSYDALPLLQVYGSGTITIGGQEITIADAGYSSVFIDSAMQDCYSGVNNCNNFVSFSNYEFPVLKPGRNAITLGGNITRVVITPRTWEL